MHIERTDQFEPALMAALALDHCTLMEVRLDPEVITTRATMTAIRDAAIQKRSR